MTFHLAGINNQNFLMRDEQTGTYWQQVSGEAISGPLKGKALTLVHSDELSFHVWRSEHPQGEVLAPVTVNVHDYAKADWEQKVAKMPTVIGFSGSPLNNRDLIAGITVPGAARAYPVQTLQKEPAVLDRVGDVPVLIVTGPDGKSMRAFVRRVQGVPVDFFRKTGNEQSPARDLNPGHPVTPDPKAAVSSPASPIAANPKPGDLRNAKSAETWALVDSRTMSDWDFQGCAVSGAAAGQCLQPLDLMQDYWFDWRQYHPATTVYRR